MAKVCNNRKEEDSNRVWRSEKYGYRNSFYI